jgi:hypothetical protein
MAVDGTWDAVLTRRGLANRYDKLATTYRSAVVLNAVIAWTRHLQDTR